MLTRPVNDRVNERKSISGKDGYLPLLQHSEVKVSLATGVCAPHNGPSPNRNTILKSHISCIIRFFFSG